MRDLNHGTKDRGEQCRNQQRGEHRGLAGACIGRNACLRLAHASGEPLCDLVVPPKAQFRADGLERSRAAMAMYSGVIKPANDRHEPTPYRKNNINSIRATPPFARYCHDFPIRLAQPSVALDLAGARRTSVRPRGVHGASNSERCLHTPLAAPHQRGQYAIDDILKSGPARKRPARHSGRPRARCSRWKEGSAVGTRAHSASVPWAAAELCEAP